MRVRPAEEPGFGGCFVQEQTRRAILDGADVFHATVLECRDQCETELLVRIADAGVLLQPVEGRGVQIENVVNRPVAPLNPDLVQLVAWIIKAADDGQCRSRFIDTVVRDDRCLGYRTDVDLTR